MPRSESLDPGQLDAAARRRAAVVAGHTGGAEMARELLGDPDPSVRCAALGALARLGELRHDELARAASDEAAAVRRRAAELLRSLQLRDDEPGVVGEVLRRLLADPDATVVEAAAWASGERQPTAPGTVETLCEIAATHRDPICREVAVAALGAIGDVGGLPAILAALRDKSTVRRRAVIALAPFEGAMVTAALRRCLGDRDRQVRQVAEDLLFPRDT